MHWVCFNLLVNMDKPVLRSDDEVIWLVGGQMSNCQPTKFLQKEMF